MTSKELWELSQTYVNEETPHTRTSDVEEQIGEGYEAGFKKACELFLAKMEDANYPLSEARAFCKDLL